MKYKSHKGTTYNNLYIELEKRGITQKDLADLLGVSTRHITQWMSRRVSPNIFFALKIAEILGIDVSKVFSLEPFPIEKPKHKSMLYSLIKSKKMNVRKLSKAIDIPESTIHKWVNKRSYPNRERSRILMEYFNLPIEKIME